ncbi:nicotinate-nucleotide--dimethylbenzimidazole phosphoribosyltransferase, partial [Streptomyces sp. NPDC058735]
GAGEAAPAEAGAADPQAPAADAPADGGAADPAAAAGEQPAAPTVAPEAGRASGAEAVTGPEQDTEALPEAAPQAVSTEDAEGAAPAPDTEGPAAAADQVPTADGTAPAAAPAPVAAGGQVPVPETPETAAQAPDVPAAEQPPAEAAPAVAPEADASAPAAPAARAAAPEPHAAAAEPADEPAAPTPAQEPQAAAAETPAQLPGEATPEAGSAAPEAPGEPAAETPAQLPGEATPEAGPAALDDPAAAEAAEAAAAQAVPAAEPLVAEPGVPVAEPVPTPVATPVEATGADSPAPGRQAEILAPVAPEAPEAPEVTPPAPAPESATPPTPAEATVSEQPTAADATPAPAEDVTVALPAEAPVQGPQQSPPVRPGAPEPAAHVPAPREGDGADDAELVQNADDLDTRATEQGDLTDQESHESESAAAVSEARQPTGPAAPAYDPAEREAVLKVIRERRDIRNGFRSDPIPHEVLLRVLEAAHHAPSVGHSQPWDFVVIRSADTRRAMHELATRQRDAYAKSLPKGRAKQFKELKIEAILDTPVNIVVTADPTRGGRHTLGRHTQPQMAPYSAALAVENLWLAARAEGLGVGWVSFFDEREMVRALGLPEHLEVIAYLCVGYVDEFPDEPELLQAGWSKRRPLSWVVHEETYGRRALPGEEPHDLLAETVAQIRPLDAKALGEAWERQKRMTKPAGALGMLEIISAQLSGLSRQCPPPIPEPAAVAIFAGDHGVHAQGVTPWPQEVTAQMVANFLGGGAVCNAFATQVGAEICIVDVGVAADLPATPGLLPRKIRAGTSDMTTGPAMTREEAKQAIEVGIETARDLVAAGNKALLTGEMGIGNTTASAALIAVFTGADAAEVTGRGTGINDETLARKTEVVRRALELHQPDPADPIGVLAAIGGFEHAALVGLLLGGASLRTPVILDGVSAGAAALAARAIAPEVLAACIAGHRSAEPGHVAALNKLGLRPLVDLDLRLGEGTGALLALPLVQSTARAMHEVATFDSAGVTEK